MERQNFDYLLYVGLDDDDDNWDEAEASTVLQAGEGRNEEASGPGQAGRGAAAAAAIAAEAAGAEAGEGPSAAGAAGPVDDGNQEGAVGGHGQENEPQPQEPDRGAMGDNQAVLSLAERWSCVQPVRVLVPEFRVHYQHRFTLAQLQELESAFQRSQYLTTEEAKRLASCLGVTEARVQRWFLKRREKYRRYKRL
ncbi:rhox homeobox family member 2B-like [Microtus oregoni]|uniref:rhox homeobox family member 2B-like n=2 Tax=Microtus oregoni TaxID=111838 RepID=UPI001BB0E4F3|nr:rhox homeobox family member 2B-like [Microtus oregoni]XP_041503739.1 rhox homeobox family member 2B-like [Microtus oregoni]XP_041503749.1 rhox homeobox family member 2B-like [Microtus oregoni]XP_041503754.1 rhox homeobox family member 2B-like [Microtus oregoni]XP_041503755.1 rhox homeobox family member 2B-like [Microtus oregoni]XP_041503764.1 rhox homeobox family member 2B-like [Microtus oregoni]